MVPLVSEEKTIYCCCDDVRWFHHSKCMKLYFFTLKNSFFETALFEISNNEFKRRHENEVWVGDGKLKINFQGP